MEQFKLVSEYEPKGDQVKAIEELTNGILKGKKEQVLLGATGTGKTFTISNVIKNVNKPTLVLAHNKTLAGQLYSELKEFFPDNRVEYFVSYFDYYQPEAYLPSSDTYIDKTTKSNAEIEMLRGSALNSCLSRNDVIVVASVACIYGASDPREYESMVYTVRVGMEVTRKDVVNNLVDRQYKRNDVEPTGGCFRVRGDIIDIYPSWANSFFYRIEMFDDEIESIAMLDILNQRKIETYPVLRIFPAHGYATSEARMQEAIKRIEAELKHRLAYFENEGKLLEKQRLEQRCSHDVELLKEFGMCPGIENYSRHIDLRAKDQKPYTLLDFFKDDFLVVVDESHVMLPQIRGMFNGDRARKQTLVDYGFRLESALDNRPLRFEEFVEVTNQKIYVSATPGDYELEQVNHQIVEQIIRPTGLLDPKVEVRKPLGQVDDIFDEINKQIEKDERTLITTLTVQMAKELTDYLKEKGLKVAHMNHEIKTLERIEIINDLRAGKYDVLVGINLLREGLDLPEVSLICILDADKEGFLRSSKSLVQIIGRAARNDNGRVIMYADRITDSMNYAINETARRREIQEKYNLEHNIIPQTIKKDIRENIKSKEVVDDVISQMKNKNKLTRLERDKLIDQLKDEMNMAAKSLDFEEAARLRDLIIELS
ncbi:excinuclease ABC subunit UvrB [Erysipelotrichaceae bacterium OttesenSCG-928-M19]|nr:excinuclease ABC subunit UvrB [Erysipelotrichaceae bacterium OttesenSCG-928-M19]